MTTTTERVTVCDWCGIEERMKVDGGITAKNKWVRVQVYALTHADPEITWEVCPYCWSVMQARKAGALLPGRKPKA